MTEALSNHDKNEQNQWHITPEEHKALPKPEDATPDAHGADPQLLAEQARHSVELSATEDNPLKKLEAQEKAETPLAPSTVNRELKAISLRRELKGLQREESLPQRTLSKVIHQPAIGALSEMASKSVSRPSGMLGGGLVALLGTSSYLYLAKHYSFAYNYLVFLLLFVGGFIIGLCLELIVHWATAARRNE